MAISIVTQQPSLNMENDEDETAVQPPPEYWSRQSGLAKCPSNGAITPMKDLKRRNGQNGTCWNRKIAFLLFALVAIVFLIAFLYIKRQQFMATSAKRGAHHGEHTLADRENEQRKKKMERPVWEHWLETIDLSKRKKPQFERFIFTEPMEGPLGNQMFRFASLYAIGQMLNRTPVYVSEDVDMRKMSGQGELEAIFPHFAEQVYFLKEDIDDVKKVAMAKDCCDYHEPKKLLSPDVDTHRTLMLAGGPNLANYRYFDKNRHEIMKIFEFNPKMIKKVANIRKMMFKDDKMHKICVHTRTGNLDAFGQLKTFQLASAIERVIRMLPRLQMPKRTSKFSLLIFGENSEFQESINRNTFGNGVLNKVYHVVDAEMSEDEELCYAMLACDSLLLTDSLSPYAFWMGYMMPADRPKFYVRKQLGLPQIEIDTLELLPSDWFPLEEDWLKKID